jgi:Disulphide bond corrector protein DsbC
MKLAVVMIAAAMAQSWYQGDAKKNDWVQIAGTPVLHFAHGTGSGKLHTPGDELLIPTTLTVQAPQGMKIDVRYPAGHDFTLPLDGQKLNVYTGTFALDVHAVGAKLPVGKKTVPAELRYQACNERSCFPPKTLKFDLEVDIAQ